jgi:integrase/recombinase XerD
MARPDVVQNNPNHYLGCYPVNLSQLFNHDSAKENPSSQIPFARFSSASFYRGTILWQQQPSLRRKSLERCIAQVRRSNTGSADHAIRYLQDLYRRNCKAGTIRSATTTIVQFLMFLNQQGFNAVEHTTRQDIEAFVELLQDRGLKIGTVRTRLNALYAFIQFLSTANPIDPHILLCKVKLKMPQRLPRAIPVEDVNQLIAAINSTRDRAMILLLLRTGMRIGELLGLVVNDVDLNTRTVKIFIGEKNHIGRVVYFSEDARQALEAWLKERYRHKPCLFYGQGRSRFSYNGARMMFKKYLKKAQLDHKGYSLHCLRHTFATELLNAGMRLECLQQLLGHRRIEITRIYARLSDKSRAAEYFKAMAIIEGDQAHGSEQLDHQL